MNETQMLSLVGERVSHGRYPCDRKSIGGQLGIRHL